jgi:dTMP kinase
VSSNQIHQGGKIVNAKERKEFLQWLDTMEHTVFNIPRPDAVVYLSVPLAVTRELLAKRDAEAVRGYKGAKKDVHENDPKHLENARASALKLVKELPYFIQVDCVEKKTLLSREVIAEKVYAVVSPLIKK